jgi:NAD(P)-dependent dehydrogenase (short-subunit alcohol dehydrogenase family)
MNLSGKTALVTGSARRIGKAVALALSGLGADVVVHYRSSQAEARAVVSELTTLGVRSIAVEADLATETATKRLFEKALRLTGHLDILINSASIFEENCLEDVTYEDFHRNLDINALAPFSLAREFHQHLEKERREGVLIDFLDSRVTDYDRRHIAYAIGKRALHTLNRMAAEEFAPLLRVNAVAPGLILPPEGEDKTYLERLKGTNPLRNHGTVKEVTEAVLFLVNNEFVTGQTIWVDGGRHLRGNFYG